MRTQRSLTVEVLLYMLLGFFLGIVGLVLGSGESRTGRYAGTEPIGCWLIAFCLGIYAQRWMRMSPEQRTIRLGRGLVRMIAILFPLALLSTLAEGMIDLTVDHGPPDPSVSLSMLALQASFVCISWGFGMLVYSTMVSVADFFRNLKRSIPR